jgi:hypothetical protein
MSHFRYTIKELKEMDDVKFISAILVEREGDCTNIYAPLTRRIQTTRLRLEQGTLTGYLQKGKS